MAIKIPIDIPVNDSKLLKAKKALEELYKLAEKSKKQTMNAPSGVSPTSPLGKPSKASTILEKAMNDLAKAYKKEKQVMEKQGKARYAWEKAKFVGGKVGRFAGAAAEGVHTGASLLSRGTSGQSEYTSGGFMNAVHDKISFGQDVYSKAREGYGSIKEAYKGQKEERDEEGNITKPARKGGVMAGVIAGIPVVGGMLGSMVGGFMKQVDDMGKEWTSVIGSQRGTMGATGSYVGGGGGYFANTEMARSQIAFNRTQGAFGNKSLMGSDKSAVAFAAQQNIGIAQYAEQLGQIKENDKSVSTDFLRGAADINKMTGLKQGQFVAKLASYSSMLKESGFGKGNAGKFAAMTGGLAKAGSLTGERAFGMGQAIDQGVRKGFEGGAISTLIVGELAKTMGKSIPRAQAYLEEHGMADENVMSAANTVSKRFMATERSQEVGAELFANEGLMKRFEFYKMAESQKAGGKLFTPAAISPLEKLTGVTGNIPLSRENERKEVFAKDKEGSGTAGEAARHAAENAYKLSEAQLKAFQALAPALDPLIKLMGEGEDSLIKGIRGLTTQIKGVMDIVTKGQKEGFGKTIGEEIGKHVKLF